MQMSEFFKIIRVKAQLFSQRNKIEKLKIVARNLSIVLHKL